MYRLRGSTRRLAALVLLLLGVIMSHLVLELEPDANEPSALQQRLAQNLLRANHTGSRNKYGYWKFWKGISGSSGKHGEGNLLVVPSISDNDDTSSDEEDPFPPPLYGYASIEELQGRAARFPSVQERVQVYMSNWYLPSCSSSSGTKNGGSTTRGKEDDGLIHYRFSNPADNNYDPGALFLREVVSQAAPQSRPRVFQLDGNTTLGKLHYMEHEKMQPDLCDSEYCVDILRHWYPAMERVLGRLESSAETNSALPPVLFQFSDDELSRAYRPATDKNEPYPKLPHLKKSRLSLLPQDILPEKQCDPVPKPILPILVPTEHIPDHLQPIVYKLKTNRHYGMMGRIPPQDLPWSEKKDQVVFRGTLTGLLPPDSRFGLATRNSHAPTLSDQDAHEKCLELDRCRLVYQTNAFYQQQQKQNSGSKKKKVEPSLVDAKLVLPMLQHTDMPERIHNVDLFGDRKTKQELLGYKAIIMLEGNDAGTGFKWALFSNSVVMTAARPKFTSWAMEELLEPWLHYIPLDPDHFGQDAHDKMKWVLEHDEEAQAIAKRGSLWMRDLLNHPDAVPDDEAVSDAMVRRYMQHFVHDDSASAVAFKDAVSEGEEMDE